ncbi:uncharacterized protein STEHIDRAFT_67256 [Stereum hirsutum FP-91666 SS1]|uniref:uncharacterized protein n=1 Tax=Stereum hirsutum (strain FP-91666) TaxID=721885 RepID=UPI0004449387|nr:uncharacterized protein STEHIDRAFT_67256 [Stereum hirsutum FP-91666 SS1]EIM81062.1 hypothetical protein STEHIDRAFT_67256 [Stereum hirsutum FP-91666 SS1]
MFGRHQPRATIIKLTAIGGLLSFITLLYFSTNPSYRSRLASSFFSERKRASCPPRAWSNGTWQHKPHNVSHPLTQQEDVFDFSDLEGCTSDREFYWHLGVDHDDQYERFPDVMDYEWVPSDECTGVRKMDAGMFVRDLVQEGGWLVLGDSITENHFFSLSCSLFPHVRSTPNYTENPYFDRAWPQNLYLNPSSPIIPSLSLPPGFSIESTPLVTFRRIDLLLSQSEIESVHRSIHPEMYESESDPSVPEEERFKLFSDEAFWTMSPAEYMKIFTSPLPGARYGTLIVSTAGHWTTTLFGGLRDESKEDSGYGIESVLELFRESMKVWAGEVQRALVEDQRRQMREAVVVRAYLPGHENCRNIKSPWEEWVPYTVNWYNWPWIPNMNKIFESILDSPSYPDVHFLPIDRPALLRPDAHVSGDCLHLMTGTGVIEGWSRYIWHYVTREIPGRIR